MQFFTFLGFCPQLKQLRFMQGNPFRNFSNNLCRSLARYNSVKDIVDTFIIAIRKMYVRRIMVFPQQIDNYSIKSRNFGHINNIFTVQIYYIIFKKQNYATGR